jgi:hypothetical protein
MVAAIGREPSKNETGATLGGARPKTKVADSVKVSPLWQSLALRPDALQPKLTVGLADDPHEREADRVAEPGAEPICGDDMGGISPAPSPAEVRRAGVSGGGGEPLAPNAQSELAARFGPQVDRIRVHDDGEAASRAAEMNARAYTVGGHIYFGAGERRPGANAGRKLLAHEAAHAAEQLFGRDPSRVRVQRALVPPPTKLFTDKRPPSVDLDAQGTEADLDKRIRNRQQQLLDKKNPADPNRYYLGNVDFQGLPEGDALISGQPADRLRRAAKFALLDNIFLDPSTWVDLEMRIRVQLETIGSSYAMVVVRVNANRDAEVIFQGVSEQTHGDTASPHALQAELSSTFTITFVANDAVNVKLKGMQNAVTFPHKPWDSGNDLALLKQALGLLRPAELAIVNGLSFRRLQGANYNGVAGFHSQSDRSLNLFDDAFPVEQDEWYLIGGAFQSGGVRTAAHEIGHALEDATPAGAATTVQQQFQTAVLAEWGKRVPPAKRFPPPAGIPLPTAYAARGWGEFFAEAYSIYRVNPAFLQNAEYQYLHDFFIAQFP